LVELLLSQPIECEIFRGGLREDLEARELTLWLECLRRACRPDVEIMYDFGCSPENFGYPNPRNGEFGETHTRLGSEPLLRLVPNLSHEQFRRRSILDLCFEVSSMSSGLGSCGAVPTCFAPYKRMRDLRRFTVGWIRTPLVPAQDWTFFRARSFLAR